MKITKTKGFSLVELLIVIAIIAILGAMASIGWKRYVDNDNLRSAARMLQADMANAKQTSIAQGVHYHISIDVAGNSYTIEKWNADNTAKISDVSTKKPSDPENTGGDNKVKIDSNTYGDIITFQPRGTSSDGTVILKNSRPSTATITSNITGKSYVTFNMQ